MGMTCAEEHEGWLYHGTAVGTVIRAFDGTTDDRLTDGTPGRAVIGDLQTAFVAPADDRASLKRPLLVQPIFLSSGIPSVKLKILTEWTIEAVAGSPSYILPTDSLWDQALWDQATWQAETGTYMAWVGVVGLGSYASLRMSLQAAPRTVFTAWKYVYEPGGIM
jgi:hypothetical protein